VLDRVYHEQVNEIALEWPANMQRLEERVAAQGMDLRAELNGKITERQATILFLRMLDEAIESPTRERLRLMCAGMAGVFVPELDVEIKSRVVRSVAILEPSDVAILRRFVGGEVFYSGVLDPPSSLNWQTLALAGCIIVQRRVGKSSLSSADREGRERLTDVDDDREVTQLGRAVIAFLATSSDSVTLFEPTDR
jgi:hypothetical protein